MRTLTHLLVGAIATTGVIAGTAATAVAQDQTIKDARADVLYYKTLDAKPKFLNKAKSTASGVDITKAKFDYSKKKLVITYTFSKLSKKKVNVQGLIETGDATFWFANNGSNKKVDVLDLETFEPVCTGNKLVKKSGNKGTLKVTIKRSCFEDSKKVRIKSSVMTPGGQYSTSGITAHEDVVSPKKKAKEPVWTKWLKAS